jgi:uncharacterized protein YegJ (DUF2314 family)
MPRAVLKKGVNHLVEPLPPEWREGTELRVERTPVGANGSAGRSTDERMDEVQALAGKPSAGEDDKLQAVVARIRQEAKERARTAMRSIQIGSILVLCAVLGCGKRPAADPVIPVSADDPQMNAAIEKARATVPTFVNALRAPKKNQTGFSVKMAFIDGKHTEHMWLDAVRYDGKQFHGTVNNEPENVSNVKLGDQASVDASKISDWMYIENRKLVGGYTIRVLRDKLNGKEREEFDRDLPFIVE